LKFLGFFGSLPGLPLLFPPLFSEIDEESASDFAVDFSKVLFNGIPLEIKAIPTRDNGRRRDDRSRGGFSGRRERRDRDKRDSRGGGRREEKSRWKVEEEDREVIRKSREISIDRLLATRK